MATLIIIILTTICLAFIAKDVYCYSKKIEMDKFEIEHCNTDDYEAKDKEYYRNKIVVLRDIYDQVEGDIFIDEIEDNNIRILISSIESIVKE